MTIRAVSDMYMAAALLAYGTTLDKVDKTDKRRQRFIFADSIPYMIICEDDTKLKRVNTPTFDDFEQAFVTRKLWFPNGFVDCIRQIKAAIHI